MENKMITQNDFNEAKLLLDKIQEVTIKKNENLQLKNERLNIANTVLSNAGNILANAGNVYLESKRLDNENIKLNNDLANIVSDFKLKQSYLQAIFSERSKIIDKHFEAIDKGLRENNDMLVLQGLKAASDFVSTNPLDNFDTFKNVLMDKNAPLELDF